MAKEEKVSIEGRVIESLPGAQFKVVPEGFTEEQALKAKLSGKMRMNHIRILPGDYVTVEISPYDTTQGIITYRHSKKP
mgnify:CR=1 FL=1|tara:strand:+ start:57 stop:293 length:237 start_codon:yes stop_codon:yes gene_type:complete